MESMAQTQQGVRSNLKWLAYSISILTALLIILLFTIVLIDRIVSWKTQDNIYHNIADVPNYNVAMVLGTSKYLTTNR